MTLICGKSINLRVAEISDASFILGLRTQSDKARFLSPVENDLVKQQAWLQSYKQKEQAGLEYYFVIESKHAEKLGLVRVYDLQPDSFCWGSWLIIDGAPISTGLESMLLVYSFGFNQLGLNFARIDVRNDNKKVLGIHKGFGAKVINVNTVDTFFQITKDTYLKKLSKYRKYFI
ncbi:GNAT family N-acetyltransferase [Marinomonas sp. BSi20584]|uniref:GNAT family N-acetyltransferase n=1 Tax=Marinomonas sp. BSi20584 TaxID=1594462 RepID=UPI000CA878D5|nr:GNAT family N-acetyltransferase [Marinomonas sp. BSi20584]PJE53320.1 hypothetical protein TY87_21445 [Marinomonas sp. BSi20584]